MNYKKIALTLKNEGHQTILMLEIQNNAPIDINVRFLKVQNMKDWKFDVKKYTVDTSEESIILDILQISGIDVQVGYYFEKQESLE